MSNPTEGQRQEDESADLPVENPDQVTDENDPNATTTHEEDDDPQSLAGDEVKEDDN